MSLTWPCFLVYHNLHGSLLLLDLPAYIAVVFINSLLVFPRARTTSHIQVFEMWSCVLTLSDTLPYAFFFVCFFLGLRLWKIGYGNSCRKQTRQLKRTRIRVKSMMPWLIPWAKHGQPWSPCLKEDESSSGWPLNFLKVPWRFVLDNFSLLHIRVNE